MLTLKVHDSGVGIAAEEIPKLFLAFSQADPSMTRKFGGTGLGLVLSKRLSQALGGDVILVSSEPGKGSTFIASIETRTVTESKLVSASSITIRHEAEVTDQRIGKKILGLRVLLVEDSPDNQRLITTYLTKSGAHVELADNGLVGFQKAMSIQPDVVLMDVQMAVMDGHEATRKLRTAGFSKPIIALTAHAMREERDRCFASGCTDYLTKPVDRSTLVEILSRYAIR